MVIYTDDAHERNVTPHYAFSHLTLYLYIYTSVVVLHRQRRRQTRWRPRTRIIAKRKKKITDEKCVCATRRETINACPSWSVFRADVNPNNRVKRIILNVKFDTSRVS